ncbi:MAG: amidohydrolase family protein [Acetobacteraceae bacterium]
MSIADELAMQPSFTAPPGACDAHFHVFGAPGRYPYEEDLRYRPPEAPLEEYLALARHLGIERFVFVQPSAYGRDNRSLLDAMRAVGSANCRGIVDIDENAADRETLAGWHRLGVRGFRINVSPIQKPEAGLADALRPRIRHLATLAGGLGWHLDFLAPGWLLRELLPDLAGLEVDFTLAHLGLFAARAGLAGPGFQDLLTLLRSGQRHCFVKLSGVYRVSDEADFADVAPLAHALIAAAPEQIIWGSDFPHLSFAGRARTVALFDLLASWAPNAAMRARILVANPARLFGFDALQVPPGA